jgi:hypothetical protein
MKPLELTIYGLLLLVAVGFAHNAWKGEEPVARTSVVLFEPGSVGITEVLWEGERNAATLEVAGEGDELAVWVTAGKKKRLPPPAPEPVGDDDSAGDDDDSAPPEPATPAPPKYGEAELASFPGSKAARELVGRYGPLTALRQFDGLGDVELEEMGLLDPIATLLLRAGSKELQLEVGDKAYASSDTYVREPGSTTVYLLSSKDIGPLRSASTNLRDRDLLGFGAADAIDADIQAKDVRPFRVIHQGRHDKDNSYWTTPEAPEDRDAVLDGFMKAALQVRASAYLGADEMPARGDLEPIVGLAFRGEDGGELGGMSLARRVDEERSKDEEIVYEWFATSHRLRGTWAKVSRSTAEEVHDALGGVLGREAVQSMPAPQ